MGAREQVVIVGDSATEGRLFPEVLPLQCYERPAANEIENAILAPRCYGGCPQHLCERCGRCKV